MFHELGIKLDKDKKFTFNDQQFWLDFDIENCAASLSMPPKSVEVEKKEENSTIIGYKSEMNINYDLDRRRPTYEFKRIEDIPTRKRENSVREPLDKGKQWYLQFTLFSF